MCQSAQISISLQKIRNSFDFLKPCFFWGQNGSLLKLFTSSLMSSVCLPACLFRIFIENKVAKGNSYNEGQISAERSSDKLLRVPKPRFTEELVVLKGFFGGNFSPCSHTSAQGTGPASWTYIQRFSGSRIQDPGFHRGGKPTREGASTYYLANFSRKLHENEEILGRWGGGGRPSCPSRSINGSCVAVGLAQLLNYPWGIPTP